ncbi:ABC transporter substrate-binding protein [Nocardia sp. NEAU-351]|uniref:ABC transporter substrate-binding protein n=1 Tax=Nocardia bovistercoris TaxID=2785916 RepID=A0A931I7F2_9NOCA|nr:ABC transporter substrate-binding protein [Nocardia bovistercoris]
MRKKAIRMAGVLCVAALAAVACGNDGDSGGGAGPGDTVKIGLLTTRSGSASAGFVGAEPGLDARLKAYQAEGGKCSDRKFEIVVADDQSSPQGALAGAQKLIQQDKVFAVAEVTPYFFGAAKYVTTSGKDTPTVGGAFDSAPQWLEPGNNLFGSVPNIPDFSKTYTTYGEFWRGLGITKIASVAYDNQASSSAMEQVLRSSDKVGISRAYINDTLPLGSTDVGAIVLGIKNSGADALYLPINPDTSLAIVGGLRQAGVNLKSIVSATGYGADLLASDPAVQAAQGMTFVSLAQPTELNTPATQKFANALKQYAGSPSGLPSFSQSYGWWAGDLLIHGLEVAGCDASQSEFMAALRADKTWDAGGQYANKVSFTELTVQTECLYMTDLSGKTFVPLPQASPICGSQIK